MGPDEGPATGSEGGWARQPMDKGCSWRRFSIATVPASPADPPERLQLDLGPYAFLALGQNRRSARSVQHSPQAHRRMKTHDRQHHCARPSARCGRPKKDGEDQAIGRSRRTRAPRSTPRSAALGNPTGIVRWAARSHDLVGADHRLPSEAEALIADKAFDAEKRVIQPLAAAGKIAVIPPKRGRNSPTTTVNSETRRAI